MFCELRLETVRKVYEQRPKRGFRRCREAKMGLKGPFRCSVRLCRRLFRPFSDGFCRGFSEVRRHQQGIRKIIRPSLQQPKRVKV
jgi:hypothetical protein